MGGIAREQTKRIATEQRVQGGRQAPGPLDRKEVARVAYELFEERGRVHGNDQQDWFDAERIVRQRSRSGNGR